MTDITNIASLWGEEGEMVNYSKNISRKQAKKRRPQHGNTPRRLNREQSHGSAAAPFLDMSICCFGSLANGLSILIFLKEPDLDFADSFVALFVLN